MPETLPFDIIIKILKMRPRDSCAKSPTSECIHAEFDDMLAHLRNICPRFTEEDMQTVCVNRFFGRYSGEVKNLKGDIRT